MEQTSGEHIYISRFVEMLSQEGAVAHYIYMQQLF